MSPRTGRPPKQGIGCSRTTNKLNIRISDQEKEDIEYVAEKLNMSRTDAILLGIRKLKDEIDK